MQFNTSGPAAQGVFGSPMFVSEGQFVCNICGKQLTNKANLKRHLLVHTGIRAFQCTICNKSFGHAWNLERHMRLHTGEKPFGCEVCGQTFALKQQLDRHSAVHQKKAETVSVPDT